VNVIVSTAGAVRPKPATRDDIWRHREAPDVRFHHRLVMASLVGAGIVAVLHLFDWWFRAIHVAQPVLFVALSIAFWYGVSRLVLGWINYAALTKPVPKPPLEGRRVAIFTTSAPGEPITMFEKTLAACANVRYPHTTYLLDDTQDPSFRRVAATHGAVWLELVGVPGAKAGKINRALEQTSEEFILVLDPDHLPFPEFLDRVLGHFHDPRVGFVQVSQGYYNQSRSFTAAGAAEQTYAFYGPGLMGLFGHGSSVAIGANCTFRREALCSIGGHGVGLAEDLVTAIRLHAEGWRSVYVPEIVSRGLVPEDLGSFRKQQLKWSRGVYEVAFSELPRLFTRLSWRQRLSYLTIGTYYLCGMTTAMFLVFPYVYLWTGQQPASMRFEEFLAACAPVAVIGCAIYFFVQRWLCDPSTERGTHWRGLVLKLTCWPVFFAGTVLAIFRADIPYVPTSKEAVRGRFIRLAWPQCVLIGMYVATVLRVGYTRMTIVPEAALQLSAEAVWGMLAFATLPVVAAIGSLYAAWEAREPLPSAPWDEIDVDRLGGRS
jgi:cellulose synthase (UDP-forming)